MNYYEAPESVKYHGGYDPSDPPEGEHWCSECSSWDDDCTCNTWGVWCSVSGGVTGSRAAWLKDKDDKVKGFSSEEEAEKEAARLMRNVSPYSTAMFSYYAKEF